MISCNSTDAFFVKYDYDALNRMTNVWENGVSKLAAYGYDALSRRTSLTRLNGTSTSYGYDAGSRLTSLTHGMPAAPNFNVAYTLGYSAANQLTSAGSNNSTYDFMQAAGSTTNDSGNGLNQSATIAAVGTGGYDVKGEVVNDGARTLTYDNDNRLTSATQAGGGNAVPWPMIPWDRWTNLEMRLSYVSKFESDFNRLHIGSLALRQWGRDKCGAADQSCNIPK